MGKLNSNRNRVLISVLLGALCLAVCATRTRADVTEASAGGFTVKITMNVHVSPADLYQRLINIGDWWSSAHTFSGDAHNLSIDPRPMGCFCEKLPGGGAVRHMEVIYLVPGKTLRMSGAMGPLQSMPISAVLTFAIAPEGDGSKLDLTYAAGGYAPQGLAGLAPVLNKVMTEQVTRLKSFAETGNPAPAAQSK